MKTKNLTIGNTALIISMLSLIPLTRSYAASTTDDREAIRPFHFTASKEALADMRKRIAATRWPDKETVTDASQGVQLATMQKLARYWATDYDWSKCEAKLKALPQFVTNIDGVDIHFIHVRSKEKNALPVIITHGWPGSIIGGGGWGAPPRPQERHVAASWPSTRSPFLSSPPPSCTLPWARPASRPPAPPERRSA